MLSVNPITVDNYAAFFNCTPVGRALCSMMALTYDCSFWLVGAVASCLLPGPPGFSWCFSLAPDFQWCCLVHRALHRRAACCILGLHFQFILDVIMIYMFVLGDSLASRGPDGWLVVLNHCSSRGRGYAYKTSLSPPIILCY